LTVDANTGIAAGACLRKELAEEKCE